MNLLKKFHKDRPSPDDELNQEPMDEEQGGIDVEPQSEPVKRINRGIIFLVCVVFIGALGATMYSCGGPSPSKPKVDVSTTKDEALTDQQLSDLEKKAAMDKNKKDALGNSKDNKNGVSNGKNQKYYIDKNGNYIARDSSSAPSSSSSSASSRPSYSSSSSSSYAAAPSSQPAPITPYEKYQEDSQKAYYKRRLSDEETAASDERNGQKSQIFFNLDGDKKAQAKRNTSSEPAANQYYNDGTVPENSSDDDYIQVVGPRQQKDRW